MTPEEWSRIYAVYEAACELPAEARTAFVESSLPEGRLRAGTFELLAQLDEPDESTAVAPPVVESTPGLRPGDLLGRFQIMDLVGRGGMGEVYRALDPELGRHVAIKCVAGRRLGDATAVQSFIREARSASALNHPGVVTVHEVIRTGDTVAIVMEFAEGDALRTLCGASQPVDRVAEWGRQIAEALAASHAAGIVHRDIKPENLMLRTDGYVKILDFGVARHGTDAGTPEGDAVAGTLRYMSPEQSSGQTITPATDVFSLAIVLYELATGTHPFAQASGERNSTLSVTHAIISFEPKPASDVLRALPGEFSQLLTAMMAKQPSARPAAAEVARRLTAFLTNRRAASSRVQWRYALAALAFVVICAVAMYALLPRTAPRSKAEPARLRGELLTGAPGAEGSPTFSPDSQTVAYAWNGGEGTARDIYIKRVNEGDPVQLTTDAADEWDPSWSPDGHRVAFLRQAAGRIEVVTVPAAGGETKVVAAITQALPEVTERLSWSADPDTLIISDDPTGKAANFHLHRLSIRTGERTLLAAWRDRLLAASVSGRPLDRFSSLSRQHANRTHSPGRGWRVPPACRGRRSARDYVARQPSNRGRSRPDPLRSASGGGSRWRSAGRFSIRNSAR